MIETGNIVCGAIFLLGGVYCLLIAYRIIPVNPKSRETSELWYRKFGTLMKIIGPALIVGGIALFLGLL
jgi:hypothetical protein